MALVRIFDPTRTRVVVGTESKWLSEHLENDPNYSLQYSIITRREQGRTLQEYANYFIPHVRNHFAAQTNPPMIIKANETIIRKRDRPPFVAKVLVYSLEKQNFFYGFPKGRAEPVDGRNPLNTAVREVFEETGFNIDINKLILRGNNDSFRIYDYYCNPAEFNQLQIDIINKNNSNIGELHNIRIVNLVDVIDVQGNPKLNAPSTYAKGLSIMPDPRILTAIRLFIEAKDRAENEIQLAAINENINSLENHINGTVILTPEVLERKLDAATNTIRRNQNDLHRLGGYYDKYMKYKLKYLKLKQELDNN
jgi:8-oxo-dGTP pyrophosphatase MutT (NUDIX family)